jgi:hypothetical protein
MKDITNDTMFFYRMCYTLNMELNLLPPECSHLHVTETITRHYMATLEDPAEDVGYTTCNDCGETFELGEYPEEAEVKTVNGMDEGPDPFDDIDIPERDYPEL